jgi:hypothetical protein
LADLPNRSKNTDSTTYGTYIKYKTDPSKSTIETGTKYLCIKTRSTLLDWKSIAKIAAIGTVAAGAFWYFHHWYTQQENPAETQLQKTNAELTSAITTCHRDLSSLQTSTASGSLKAALEEETDQCATPECRRTFKELKHALTNPQNSKATFAKKHA